MSQELKPGKTVSESKRLVVIHRVATMVDCTFAAAGDAIITRQLSHTDDDQTEALLDHIRDTDAGFVNLEVLLHDYEGYPNANSGGTYMRAPPWVADELTQAGFDVFAAANNHVGDYSHGGMEATMRELEARDIPYAGLGRTLAQAREPAFTETPGGRVSVVAACSTITPGTEAGQQRPDMQGRPGLSPLSLSTRYEIPGDALEQAKELAESLGLEELKRDRKAFGFPVPGEDQEGFTLPNVGDGDNMNFVEADDHAIVREPNVEDIEAVLRQIRAADRQSDLVVASLHAHEGTGGSRNNETIPTWLEEFARDCITAGADIFVGHGPHVLRGIEVYEGAPIFYSLGNFIMENETVTRLPAEIYDRYDLDPLDSHPADLFDERVFDEDGERIGFLSKRSFWETVVPICHFNDDGLVRVVLHPADLGYEKPRARRGYPRLADEKTSERILEELADLSEPYGTQIELEGGVGVIS